MVSSKFRRWLATALLGGLVSPALCAQYVAPEGAFYGLDGAPEWGMLWDEGARLSGDDGSPVAASVYRGTSLGLGAGEELYTGLRDGDWGLELYRSFSATSAPRMSALPRAEALHLQRMDAILSYRPEWLSSSFEVLGGLRYRGSGEGVGIGDGASAGARYDRFSPVVGGRVGMDLSDLTYFSLQGDLGGLAGSNPLEWSATALFGYEWEEEQSILFGYRVFGHDLVEGEARNVLEFDFEHSGPMLELNLAF